MIDRRDWKSWVGVVARLVLGGVLVAASVTKLGNPYAVVQSVRAYDIFPDALNRLIGYSLPTVELMIGTTLIVGLLVRIGAVLGGGLMVLFIAGIASVWARGLEIDCGCFGSGGYKPGASAQYPWEIARDAGLLLLAAWLVWRPRSPFAVDNLLFRSSPSIERIEEVEDVETV